METFLWALKYVRFPVLSQFYEHTLPIVVKAVQQPSRPIQQRGLKALSHFIQHVAVAQLKWHDALLLSLLERALLGCGYSCWKPALEAAVGAAVRIGGRNVGCDWHDCIFSGLLKGLGSQ